MALIYCGGLSFCLTILRYVLLRDLSYIPKPQNFINGHMFLRTEREKYISIILSHILQNSIISVLGDLPIYS